MRVEKWTAPLPLEQLNAPPAPKDTAVVETAVNDDSAAVVETSQETDEVDEPAGYPKGVIRNLLNGHYKGVAAIRLRINFYDELQRLEGDAAAADAKEDLAKYSSDFDSTFSAGLEALGLPAEQTDQVVSLAKDYSSRLAMMVNQASDPNVLIKNFENENNIFLASLKNVLMPAVPSEEEVSQPLPDPAVPSDEEEEVAQPLPDEAVLSFLSTLEQAAANALSALKTPPESLLPQISPPKNNGGAFEKFLSQYSSLAAPTNETLSKVA